MKNREFFSIFYYSGNIIQKNTNLMSKKTQNKSFILSSTPYLLDMKENY